jgi:hypothetical protein
MSRIFAALVLVLASSGASGTKYSLYTFKECGAASYIEHLTISSVSERVRAALLREVTAREILDSDKELPDQSELSASLPVVRLHLAIENGTCAVVAIEHSDGPRWVSVRVIRESSEGLKIRPPEVAIKVPMSGSDLHKYLPAF